MAQSKNEPKWIGRPVKIEETKNISWNKNIKIIQIDPLTISEAYFVSLET